MRARRSRARSTAKGSDVTDSADSTSTSTDELNTRKVDPIHNVGRTIFIAAACSLRFLGICAGTSHADVFASVCSGRTTVEFDDKEHTSKAGGVSKVPFGSSELW